MHVEPSKKSFRPSGPNDTKPSEEQANFASKDITILPDELLVKIFSYLDTGELTHCQLVNRHWQELIDDHMLALAFYRRCHPSERRTNPLTVERYHSSIRGWLKGFSDLGRESAAQLDKFLQHKHFTEILFFSIAKVLAKAKALTGQDVGTITHSNLVNKASFSPDGNYLLTTVALDHSVTISEFVAGQWQEKATSQQFYRVKKASFSPDGKRLVTASYDNTAEIWELEGGQWQKKNTLQDSGLRDAFFSPDGCHLMTISSAAKIWEFEGGQWQTKAIIRYSSPVASACFSSDGNYLVIAVADTPKIWALVDGEWKQSATLKHSSMVNNVSFSPDGNHLLTVTDDWTAKIWGAVAGQWLEKATIGHSGSLRTASFSPDGSHIVTASDRTAKIWGLFKGHWQEKITIPHFSSVRGASFSPDGKHLVLSSHDYTDKIWGLTGGQWRPKATIENSGLVKNTSFSPDGIHLVTTSDFIAKIWVLKSKDNNDSC